MLKHNLRTFSLMRCLLTFDCYQMACVVGEMVGYFLQSCKQKTKDIISPWTPEQVIKRCSDRTECSIIYNNHQHSTEWLFSLTDNGTGQFSVASFVTDRSKSLLENFLLRSRLSRSKTTLGTGASRRNPEDLDTADMNQGRITQDCRDQMALLRKLTQRMTVGKWGVSDKLSVSGLGCLAWFIACARVLG